MNHKLKDSASQQSDFREVSAGKSWPSILTTTLPRRDSCTIEITRKALRSSTSGCRLQRIMILKKDGITSSPDRAENAGKEDQNWQLQNHGLLIKLKVQINSQFPSRSLNSMEAEANYMNLNKGYNWTQKGIKNSFKTTNMRTWHCIEDCSL